MDALAWEVILAAGVVFVLGATSPGPSLMVVLRNTMIGGRRQGVMCALGHGLGFGIYAGMAVFGLIVLLEEAPSVQRLKDSPRGLPLRSSIPKLRCIWWRCSLRFCSPT